MRAREPLRLASSMIFTTENFLKDNGPEDMQLVTGAHGFRRDALDALGSQLSRTHRVLRRDYLKIVKHKNSLMKNGIEGFLLDSVNDMLVTSGSHLYVYRAALFDNLAVRIARAYSEISSSGFPIMPFCDSNTPPGLRRAHIT